MDPTVLAWALAQPPGSRAAALASAYQPVDEIAVA
jgi:hypothetical protein